MTDPVAETAVIAPTMAGWRLDQALAALFPHYSRRQLQVWLKAGQVSIDGSTGRKSKDSVNGGEHVVLRATLTPSTEWRAEALPLTILHEDDDIIVVDKPADCVVHPAAGNADGTLVNALLHHDPGLANLPRAGIVHRLDKDTSGLLVVARSARAHASLVAQLQARTVQREYLALVNGLVVAGGCIEGNIGRHPRDRKRMAVLEHGGKPARTHYLVQRRYAAHTLLAVRLETGRTHQIRVHLASRRLHIVGDPVYGGRLTVPKHASPRVLEALRGFKRQALHACRLSLQHPGRGVTLAWEAEPPEDMARLLAVLAEEGES